MAPLLRAAVLLGLLLALVASAGAQSSNYSVLYKNDPICDLATDGVGAVYVLLCDGPVVKLAANGSQLTSFETQYNNAIANSTAYAKPLSPQMLRVSASGVVWVQDYTNAQLVGVANVTSSTPSISVISTVALGDIWSFSIAPNSENLWILAQGADYVLQLITPQGAPLLKWNATNVPAVADYFIFTIGATATSLYVGGCYPGSAFSYEFYQYEGYADEAIDFYDPFAVQGCDVRQLSANGTLLRTFTAVRPATNYGYLDVPFWETIVVDNRGLVYANDGFGGWVYQWSSDGTQTLTSNTPYYTDLASAPSGAIYAATPSDRLAVVTVSPVDLSALSTVEIYPQAFGNDQSVAISPDGRILYATSAAGNRILQLNASTGAIIGSLGLGILSQSEWVTTDSAGNLYVSDSTVPAVYKLSSNGTLLLTITGSPTTPFADPEGVAVNPTTGELIVVDSQNALLYIFSANGSFSRSIDTTQFTNFYENAQTNPYYYYYYYSYPLSVAVSATGTIVYVDLQLFDVVVIPAVGNASLLSSALISVDVFESPPLSHSALQRPSCCALHSAHIVAGPAV